MGKLRGTGNKRDVMTRIPIGKLPAELLERLLNRYVPSDARVVVGPGIGVDAAIIEMGDRCLVAKTDPVTFATEEIGWYAVHVNANDVACCGAKPSWFLATLLLPEGGTTTELAESIFRQIAQACRQLGVSLCGGHTEITYDLKRPIVIGQMLGEVACDGYITARGAQIGDRLIVTKGVAVEGTASIAKEKAAELSGVLSVADLKRCRDFLHDPGISVVPDAQLALAVGGVHALHDPTEGGIATGLWELAEAANVGLHINEHSIPVLPECETVCQHLGLDPLGLIGSGALLIAADKHYAETIIERLRSAGIAAAIIGDVVPVAQGRNMHDSDQTVRPLPRFARDEITRLFE